MMSQRTSPNSLKPLILPGCRQSNALDDHLSLFHDGEAGLKGLTSMGIECWLVTSTPVGKRGGQRWLAAEASPYQVSSEYESEYRSFRPWNPTTLRLTGGDTKKIISKLEVEFCTRSGSAANSTAEFAALLGEKSCPGCQGHHTVERHQISTGLQSPYFGTWRSLSLKPTTAVSAGVPCLGRSLVDWICI